MSCTNFGVLNEQSEKAAADKRAVPRGKKSTVLSYVRKSMQWQKAE